MSIKKILYMRKYIIQLSIISYFSVYMCLHGFFVVDDILSIKILSYPYYRLM